MITGRGDIQPKSAAAKQAIADLATREKEAAAKASKPAQDASVAATQGTLTAGSSSVPQRSSSRSSRAAAETIRILNKLGKRARRSSSSSSTGKGTPTIPDSETESPSMPTTRSRTAGKRTRIQLLSFEPPETVQETKETESTKEIQAVDVEAEAKAVPAEDGPGTRKTGVSTVRPHNTFQPTLVFI